MAGHSDVMQHQTFRIGEFVLTMSPLELRKADRPVAVPAKALGLLVLLVSRRGALVNHEDIRAHLWPDRTVDYAGSIHVYIRQLRTALGDSAEAPRFIETLPRQGYRFVAEVEFAGDHTAETRPPARRSLRFGLMAAGVALVSVFVAAIFIGASPPAPVALEMRTESTSADGAYKRGVYLLERPGEDAAMKAVGFFQQAVAADPDFALAHLGLSRAYVRIRNIDAARSHAATAMRLAADSDAAYVTAGQIALMHDWDFAAARTSFEKALMLNPESAEAHQGIATILALSGEFERTYAHMEQAMNIDPASTLIRADYGWYRFYAGDDAGAAALCREALVLEPDAIGSRLCLIRALLNLNAGDEARERVRNFMRDRGATDEDITLVLRQPADQLSVTFDGWRLQRMTASVEGQASYASLAFAAAGAREPARMYSYAAQAIEAREPMAIFFGLDPAFAPYRTDDRFQALLRELGLPVSATPRTVDGL